MRCFSGCFMERIPAEKHQFPSSECGGADACARTTESGTITVNTILGSFSGFAIIGVRTSCLSYTNYNYILLTRAEQTCQ